MAVRTHMPFWARDSSGFGALQVKILMGFGQKLRNMSGMYVSVAGMVYYVRLDSLCVRILGPLGPRPQKGQG